MICSVAMAIGPMVISLPKPARHDQIYKRLSKDLNAIYTGQEECGFLDDKGSFLSRLEAYHHAVGCGQIKAGDTECLISEDLW